MLLAEVQFWLTAQATVLGLGQHAASYGSIPAGSTSCMNNIRTTYCSSRSHSSLQHKLQGQAQDMLLVKVQFQLAAQATGIGVRQYAAVCGPIPVCRLSNSARTRTTCCQLWSHSSLQHKQQGQDSDNMLLVKIQFQLLAQTTWLGLGQHAASQDSISASSTSYRARTRTTCSQPRFNFSQQHVLDQDQDNMLPAKVPFQLAAQATGLALGQHAASQGPISASSTSYRSRTWTTCCQPRFHFSQQHKLVQVLF